MAHYRPDTASPVRSGQKKPALLSAGATVRFEPISKDMFDNWETEAEE
ncbi:hypothetical protein [Sphingopyxis sp. BSNA05]|nr:hypothetical protein [Sphingopyxis sp. BSNA05]